METKEQQKRNAEILRTAVLEKWNIIRLSRTKGTTIAETSRWLNGLAKRDKFREVFESLHWPLNVSSGHIYTGSFSTEKGPDIEEIRKLRLKIKNLILRGQKFDKSTDKSRSTRQKFYLYIKKVEKQIKELPNIVGGSMVHGERNDILRPGMHVFVKPIQGKPFSEIFLVKQEIEYLVIFGYNTREKIPTFVKQREAWFTKKDIHNGKMEEFGKEGKYKKVKKGGKTRIRYKTGHWMGVAPSSNLISVNSKFN